MKLWKSFPFVLAITLLAACSQPSAQAPQDNTAAADSIVSASSITEVSSAADDTEVSDEEIYTAAAEMTDMVSIEDEAVALASAPPPAVVGILKPVASGSKVQSNAQATIDYSNTGDGYVMVKATSTGGQRLKVQVAAQTTYTYDIQSGSWTTFPLSDGNGNYKVTVFQNVSGTKYATVLSASFSVSLKDEFEPFLRPNQYVNYENAPNTVAKAQEIAGSAAPLQKVAKVYDYVIQNLTYDSAKAKSVQSGYLPVLDTVLASKKGICFDYASLMTGMLRSQGVPCKLVVGYAGTAYHAWVSVWTKETGWIDGAIFFDGTNWQRMDPTFISSSKGSENVKQFVGNGSNYTQKFLY